MSDINIRKTIKLAFDVFDLPAQIIHGVSRCATTFAFVTLHPLPEVVGPLLGKNVRREDARKIGGELFFADIGLRTASCRFFGTAIVHMTLLLFSGNSHSAFAAGHKTAIHLWLFVGRHWMPALAHHLLHLIEKLLAHDGRMSPFIYLAAVFEVSVIKDVGENECHLLIVQALAASASHAVVIEKLSNVFISRVVLGVELKGGTNYLRLLAVYHDGLGTRVV